MRFTTLLTKSTLAVALMLSIYTNKIIASDETFKCPKTFTPPADLDNKSEDGNALRIGRECSSTWYDMSKNPVYTEGRFNTFCKAKPGKLYGFTYEAKYPNNVSQQSCEVIGKFVTCYRAVKKCHQESDESCKNKLTYCDKVSPKLSSVRYKPEDDTDTTSADNTDKGA